MSTLSNQIALDSIYVSYEKELQDLKNTRDLLNTIIDEVFTKYPDEILALKTYPILSRLDKAIENLEMKSNKTKSQYSVNPATSFTDTTVK